MNNFLGPDGQPVPDEQLEVAAARGELQAIAGTRVHMIDPTGRPVTLPAEEAGKALGAGYRPEPVASVQARLRSKEFGTIGQKAITAAEGAARGVSFGLSDVVTTAIGGEEYRQRALARQVENPLTAGASEITGAVAPLLLSGGASAGASFASRAVTAPTRAASALSRAIVPLASAETAAGRMALRAAQTGLTGALEGALYGSGSAAGTAALRGDPLTAEKILSGAGVGALTGGILGAAGGAIAGRFERAGSRAGDDMLLKAKVQRLDDAIAKQSKSGLKATHSLQQTAAKLERRASIIDEFAQRQAIASLKPGPRILSRHAKSAANVDDLIREAGEDYLEYKMRSGPLAGKRIFHAAKDPVDALDDVAHAFRETDDALRQHKRIAAEVALADPKVRPDISELAQRIDVDLSKLPDNPRVKQFARKYLAPLRNVEPGRELDALEQSRALLDDALESASKPADVRPLRAMRRAVDDALNTGTEAALSKAGVDTAAFRQEARWHRSLGLVRDAVEDLKLSQFARSSVDNSAAGYALAAVLTGNIGTGALIGGAHHFANQFLRNRAGGIVSELAHRVARTDFRLNWGAKALAGDGFRHSVRPAITKALSGAAADRYYSALSEVAADPRRRIEYVARQTDGYAEQYPELAARVQVTLSGDLEYLAARVPPRVSRAAATLTPGAIKPVGSKHGESEFWERVAALEDPGYVVDQMMEGRVPRAAIETLRDRRPLIWAALRERVMVETAARSEELPFKRRVNLGLAFEFPADKSLQPGMLGDIQSSMQPAQPPGAPKKTSPADQAGTVESMQLRSDRA